MYKSKIDWCDSTWNPVTGCRHGCEYCYARGIANRFGEFSSSNFASMRDIEDYHTTIEIYEKPSNPYPYLFAPTLHHYRLDQPAQWKKPRKIFVCSMADLFGKWVPDEWIQEVFDACYAAPQHTYLFLTKNPERYEDVVEYLETDVKNSPDNPDDLPAIYLGASATNNQQLDRAYESAATWISIEPLREELFTDTNFVNFRRHDDSEYGRWLWVVIGAETGNHKDKVIPEREWVLAIAEECAFWKTPVFMKESLRALMGEDFKQEYPWTVERITNETEV